MGSFATAAILSGADFFRSRWQLSPRAPREVSAGEAKAWITGRVIDILTGEPIPSAVVDALDTEKAKLAVSAGVSPSGSFALGVPRGEYEVRATAVGYVSMSRVRQRVGGSTPLQIDFPMVPLDVSPEDEQRLYDLVVASPESPLEDPSLPQSFAPSTGAPLAVTVPETIVVDFANGRSVTMALDEYLKGVVPSEMPSSWPGEALKAQAIAARSYAVAYASRNGGHICADTRCQVYSEVRYASTNKAVDDTHNEVAVYNGSIISAFFFSKCDDSSTRNSENALAPGGPSSNLWSKCDSSRPWNYVAYCRARPCGGHGRHNNDCGYYGHGVGICQWGVKVKAGSGWNYRQIITHYYTSVTVEGGIAPPALLSPGDGTLYKSGDPVTLAWGAAGPGLEYVCELVNPAGAPQTYVTTATSWPLGGLGIGTWRWRVKARSGTNESSFSGYWRIVVADTIYKSFYPRAYKYGADSP